MMAAPSTASSKLLPESRPPKSLSLPASSPGPPPPPPPPLTPPTPPALPPPPLPPPGGGGNLGGVRASDLQAIRDEVEASSAARWFDAAVGDLRVSWGVLLGTLLAAVLLALLALLLGGVLGQVRARVRVRVRAKAGGRGSRLAQALQLGVALSLRVAAHLG